MPRSKNHLSLSHAASSPMPSPRNSPVLAQSEGSQRVSSRKSRLTIVHEMGIEAERLKIGHQKVTAFRVGQSSPFERANTLGFSTPMGRPSSVRKSHMQRSGSQNVSSSQHPSLLNDSRSSSAMDYIAQSPVVHAVADKLFSQKSFRLAAYRLARSESHLGDTPPMSRDDTPISKDTIDEEDEDQTESTHLKSHGGSADVQTVGKDEDNTVALTADEERAAIFTLFKLYVAKVTVVVLAFSSTIALVNFTKLLFATFKFPLFTTSMHMTFSFVMSMMALRFEILGVPVKDKQVDLSFAEALEIIGPFCLFGAVSIAFGNMALVNIQPGFHEMLQNMTPVWNMVLAKMVSQKTYNWQAYAALVPLCAAAVVSAKGESGEIVVWGFICSNLAAIFRSLRLIVQEVMLCQKTAASPPPNNHTSLDESRKHPETPVGAKNISFGSSDSDAHGKAVAAPPDLAADVEGAAKTPDTRKLLRKVTDFFEPLEEERPLSFAFSASRKVVAETTPERKPSDAAIQQGQSLSSASTALDDVEFEMSSDDEIDFVKSFLEVSSSSDTEEDVPEDENSPIQERALFDDVVHRDSEESMERRTEQMPAEVEAPSPTRVSVMSPPVAKKKKGKRTRQEAVAEIKRMDSITLLYYSCPLNAILFLCASLLVEGSGPVAALIPSLHDDVGAVQWTYILLLSSAAVAALFNVFSFLLVQEFGAVLSQVIGQLKTPVMLGITFVTGSGGEVSMLQVYGFLLSAGGCFFYKKYARESIDPSIPEGGYISVLFDKVYRFFGKLFWDDGSAAKKKDDDTRDGVESSPLSKVIHGVTHVMDTLGLQYFFGKMVVNMGSYFGNPRIMDDREDLRIGQSIMLSTGELMTVKATRQRNVDGDITVKTDVNTTQLDEILQERKMSPLSRFRVVAKGVRFAAKTRQRVQRRKEGDPNETQNSP